MAPMFPAVGVPREERKGFPRNCPVQRSLPGTHLRRDTFIPQRFQASKAAAASDGHAVHF